jgi:AbrB family looped-hinge helix DNA binding protein
MWQAKVTLKGQVTIPMAVRTALAIHEGYSVLFAVEGDQAILRPLKRKPLPELYGALPATRPYPGLETVRQEVRQKRAQR